jgi:hypothetical protein
MSICVGAIAMCGDVLNKNVSHAFRINSGGGMYEQCEAKYVNEIYMATIQVVALCAHLRRWTMGGVTP